jgi:Protein of unknown function (DUF2490)
MKGLTCFILISMSWTTLLAQRKEQLWLDYQLDYPFPNGLLFENTVAYQTILSKEDKWRSFSLSPSLEYVLFTWFDLTAEVGLAYTFQQENTNSFEISPIVGTRFHITQNRRFNTRLLVRYQQRNFLQIEDDDWDTSNRVRLKGELWITINGPNLFTDKLWYAILDYEEFIVLDEQLDERYANRRRARIGMGYRLNYKHRFELIYTRQSSRNEIGGEFVSNDNVIQLRYKMFLNPAKNGSQGR